MRSSKFDKRAEKAMIKALDALARKHGVADTKHAASKWLNVQRVRASAAKEKRVLEKRLEKRLSEINAKLK